MKQKFIHNSFHNENRLPEPLHHLVLEFFFHRIGFLLTKKFSIFSFFDFLWCEQFFLFFIFVCRKEFFYFFILYVYSLHIFVLCFYGCTAHALNCGTSWRQTAGVNSAQSLSWIVKCNSKLNSIKFTKDLCQF